MSKKQSFMRDIIESNKKIAIPKGFILWNFLKYQLSFFILICLSYNVLIIVTGFILIRVILVDYILFYKVWRTFEYSKYILIFSTIIVCVAAAILAPTVQKQAITLLEELFLFYRKVII